MVKDQTLRIYLEDGMRKAAARGEHNFLRLVAEVAQDSGLRVEYRANTQAERLAGHARGGYSLSHMKSPIGENGLTFRRTYHYPFWQIEQMAERWDWDVARASFDPDTVDAQAAGKFFKRWKNRLYKGVSASRGGFAYIPLQGRLMDHRSFQSCSPMEMLRTVLPTLHIPAIVTLHPKENYTEQEIQALKSLLNNHSNVELRSGGMMDLLPSCDFIITQNSSVAFDWMFFHKPSILFAKIDFHHVMVNANPETFPEALTGIETHRPDFERYLFWFWQEMSINAGRPDAKDQIRARLIRFGWPVA